MTPSPSHQRAEHDTKPRGYALTTVYISNPDTLEQYANANASLADGHGPRGSTPPAWVGELLERLGVDAEHAEEVLEEVAEEMEDTRRTLFRVVLGLALKSGTDPERIARNVHDLAAVFAPDLLPQAEWDRSRLAPAALIRAMGYGSDGQSLQKRRYRLRAAPAQITGGLMEVGGISAAALRQP